MVTVRTPSGQTVPQMTGSEMAPHPVAGEKPYRVGASFSIQPGVYLVRRFGVRIENIVTATEDGHRSLNAEPASSLIVAGA